MKSSDIEEGKYYLWTHVDPDTHEPVREKVKVIKKTGRGGSDVQRSSFPEGIKAEFPGSRDSNEMIEVELESGDTRDVKCGDLQALPDDGMTEDRE